MSIGWEAVPSGRSEGEEVFDLVSGSSRRPLRRTSRSAVLVSVLLHSLILGTFVVLPVLYVSDALPDVPTMMAFVAPPVTPPPPPPPPAPVRPVKARATPTRDVRPDVLAAPIDVPEGVEPESGIVHATPGSDFGVEGGIEGGVPGGVTGGIVGGLPQEMPPAPPPVRRDPVRVGGQIEPPALVHRVEPKYPALAVRAQIEAVVILEATVDRAGHVESVRVLRSGGILDDAAVEAVRQWRYTPLILNGVPESFILTVTLKFSLQRPIARTG